MHGQVSSDSLSAFFKQVFDKMEEEEGLGGGAARACLGVARIVVLHTLPAQSRKRLLNQKAAQACLTHLSQL